MLLIASTSSAHCHPAVQEYPGIVSMCSTTDHGQKSVLMLANVRERSIKLLELPQFSERGVLPDVSCCNWWLVLCERNQVHDWRLESLMLQQVHIGWSGG